MNEQRDDWEKLSGQWQKAELPESDVNWLEANLRRKRRGLFLANLMDAVATAALLVFVAWLVGPDLQPKESVFLVVVLAMLAFAWTLTLWNRRDGRRSHVSDLRESIAWNLERCRRQRRSIAIAWAVLVVQLVFLAVFLPSHAYASAAAFLGVFALLLAAWSWIYRRRISIEELRLRDLQKNIEGDL